MSSSILLVGSGKMGQAMLGGWVDTFVTPSDVVVVDPNVENLAVAKALGCIGHQSPVDIDGSFQPEVIVLAVKPQMMVDVLPTFQTLAANGALIISIAAGTGIAQFETAFGATASIIRAMPNTPAAVRHGMIVCCQNGHASSAQLEICDKLMTAIGTVAWIDDEKLMDAVTGLSGSGPAYVFHMIEAMAAAGVRAGLPEDLAETLAEVTVAGAGKLAIASDEPASKLRENVTSPNGTTAAGLAVLMAEDGLGPLIEKTVAAATKRSKELG
ncbi:pyrroline-5-carboxylate reductase [Sneathiella marina]|uniref:Pyrroline-5-carboxylate reductase n=1 Tax=Sneathiella marina TaxID=2950108 RepID=A0ABY4W595_9PROT|nr:pyrroline-5-carboxylate reductase [Sneathiella marina]USG62367.1 pyrroline-5-carboxylate reductase [Sneathiella marina]